jgi:hypothetical protein
MLKIIIADWSRKVPLTREALHLVDCTTKPSCQGPWMLPWPHGHLRCRCTNFLWLLSPCANLPHYPHFLASLALSPNYG